MKPFPNPPGTFFRVIGALVPYIVGTWGVRARLRPKQPEKELGMEERMGKLRMLQENSTGPLGRSFG